MFKFLNTRLDQASQVFQISTWSHLLIASLTKMRTSIAASSLVSERNSMRSGTTVVDTSGNFMHAVCKVRT